MKQSSNRKNIRFLTFGALIAALYAILTAISGLFGLSNGVIQLRLSEALTILPALVPFPLASASVMGLFIGCILANALTGALIWDMVLGSLATLLGGIGTYLLRSRPHFAWFPPVVSNAIIIPCVLQTVYGTENAYLPLACSVAVSEVLSAGVGGMLVHRWFSDHFRYHYTI